MSVRPSLAPPPVTRRRRRPKAVEPARLPRPWPPTIQASIALRLLEGCHYRGQATWAGSVISRRNGATATGDEAAGAAPLSGSRSPRKSKEA